MTGFDETDPAAFGVKAGGAGAWPVASTLMTVMLDLPATLLLCLGAPHLHEAMRRQRAH
jgi:hypothetical protein